MKPSAKNSGPLKTRGKKRKQRNLFKILFMKKLTIEQLESLLGEAMRRSSEGLSKGAAGLLKPGKGRNETVKLPDFLKDHEALLARAYVPYESVVEKNDALLLQEAQLPYEKMAARNGASLSQESIELIRALIESKKDEKTDE